MAKQTQKTLIVIVVIWGAILFLFSIVLDLQHSIELAYARPDNVCSPSYWCQVPSSNLTAPNTFNSIATISYTDAWAVGTSNQGSYGGQTLIEHWDGSLWNITSSPNPGLYDSLNSDSAYASNDVWAVGSYYTDTIGPQHTLAQHWNGTSWATATSDDPGGISGSSLNGVAVVSANHAWAVGTYNEARYTLIESCTLPALSVACVQVPSPSPSSTINVLNAVTVIHSNDVWAVGYSSDYLHDARPLTLHYDGTSWTKVPFPYLGAYSVLTSVDYFTSSDIWAVGYSQPTSGYYYEVIAHYNPNTGWTYPPSLAMRHSPDNNYNLLYHVFGTKPGDFWAVGAYGSSPSALHPWLMHWNGSGWVGIAVPEIGTSHTLLGVASTLTSTWAVGNFNQQGSGNQLTLAENYSAPTPPAYTTSHYQNQVDPNTHYQQGYCAAYKGESGVIVLDYGYPVAIPGGPANRYGTYLYNKMLVSTDVISHAVISFTQGFDASFHGITGTTCSGIRQPASQGITIAIGTNNYTFGVYSATLSSQHAAAWATMVRDVKNYAATNSYTEVLYVGAAIDAEPNWEITPTTGISTGAEIWGKGYSDQAVSHYFNFGSADGYPCIPNSPVPNPPTCSLWSPEQEGPERLYTMSWGIYQAYPLPEDYFYEWNRHWYLVKRWAKDQHSTSMIFSGVTSNCLPSDQPCYVDKNKTIIGQSIDPAWQSFWLEINSDPLVQLLNNSTYITSNTLP